MLPARHPRRHTAENEYDAHTVYVRAIARVYYGRRDDPCRTTIPVPTVGFPLLATSPTPLHESPAGKRDMIWKTTPAVWVWEDHVVTSEDIRTLIATGPLGHLTTLNGDGSPQVSVVWVGIEGDEFVSGHMGVWQKVESVRRNPRVA